MGRCGCERQRNRNNELAIDVHKKLGRRQWTFNRMDRAIVEPNAISQTGCACGKCLQRVKLAARTIGAQHEPQTVVVAPCRQPICVHCKIKNEFKSA